MRVVIQRVQFASLAIDSKVFSEIGKGLMILVGIETGDTSDDVDYLVKKIPGLRIFDDENGVMNKSVTDIGGEMMLVSQFTLHAQTRKGNRPSYIRAARHETSRPLYEEICRKMAEAAGRTVKTGVFGADMKITLLNDGPVTILMDTKNKE